MSLTAAKNNIKFKLLSCPYKIGEMVHARFLPVLYKSIYAAKSDGPYKITRIVGLNLTLEHCVTGKTISRNEHHVKKVREAQTKERYYVEKSGSSLTKQAESQYSHPPAKRFPERNRKNVARYGFGDK